MEDVYGRLEVLGEERRVGTRIPRRFKPAPRRWHHINCPVFQAIRVIWLVTDVLHSGGSPGGLSLSVILNKLNVGREHDVHIDLYESAPAFTEIGAGISVWKRT